MPRFPQQLKSLAACLACLPALLLCGTTAALEVEELEEAFDPVESVFDAKDMKAYAFTAGKMHCVALTTEDGTLSQLYLLPRDKDKSRFTAEADRMLLYLKSLGGDSLRLRMVKFAAGAPAAVILFEPEGKRPASRKVLGESTLRVLETAVGKGAHFENGYNGVVTLVLPAEDKKGERCALVLSLRKGTANVVGFSPPPSFSKKEKQAIASFAANLHLPVTALDANASAEEEREAGKQIGTRCLSVGRDYVVIVYNKKLYAGTVSSLRKFIRDRKKEESGNRTEAFTFPSASNSIPDPSASAETPEDESSSDQAEEPAGQGDSGATPSTPAKDKSSGKAPANRAEALRAYLEYLRGLQNR